MRNAHNWNGLQQPICGGVAPTGRRYEPGRRFRGGMNRPRRNGVVLRLAWIPAAMALLGACSLSAITPAVVANTEPAGMTPGATSTVLAAEPATATPAATATMTPTASPTATPMVINPFTGLPVSDAALIQRRPIAIKVSNYPRSARPQAGLSFADLLIEYYQEHGITRFHALYLSRDVPKVGPIRSGREIDARLEEAYQSYLVYNAADTKVWEFMNNVNLMGVILHEGPVQCPGLCRDNSQVHINSLYGNTVDLRSEAIRLKKPDINPNLEGMVFSEQTPAMTNTAGTIRVRFLIDMAIAQWVYNPADHKYYRWSETGKIIKNIPEMAPLKDRLTGEQLSVSNIVIVYVNYVRRQQPEMYEIELFGNGKALFFRDGKWEAGNWRMPYVDRPPQFFGPDGAFPLRPGVTWIALVEDSSQEFVEGDTVRIEFGQPAYGGG
jgi:hypothetical protein